MCIIIKMKRVFETEKIQLHGCKQNLKTGMKIIQIKINCKNNSIEKFGGKLFLKI